MEENVDLECTDATALLRELFDTEVISIKEDPNQLSLCKSKLEAMQKDNSLQSKRSFSKDVLKRNIPSYPVSEEPGSVYLFEVDVINDKALLRVTERNSSKRVSFFQLDDSINAVRVIWIYSKSVRVIDAKLRVYKEYEPYINTRNLLLHHEYDEYTEILKHSRIQKLQFLIKIITRIKESIPQDSLQAIVEEAMKKPLSFENIKQVCYQVHLRDGRYDIGTVGSEKYCCPSFITVTRIKKDLLKKTLEELAKLVGSEICQSILKHIEKEIKTFEHEFPDLRLNFSTANFNGLMEVLKFFIVAIFLPIIAVILAIKIVFTFLFPVDINDEDWRRNVAKEIHDTVCQKRKTIISKICCQKLEIFVHVL